MAVTKGSEIKSKQTVEEGVGPSCREGADAASCRLVQPRKFGGNPGCGSDKGPSTRHRDMKRDTCGVAKRYKQRSSRTKDNESDNLSDIDDAEVFGYLNTKEEIQHKRILWEAMNGNYTKAKKRKRTAELKKGASVKKAAKTTEKVESQRRSSRINYDALKFLNEEFDQASEATQVIGADSNKTNGSSYGSIGSGLHGSNESRYNEDEHGISSVKDNETLDHHDGDMYYEYGDDGDEYFDF